MQNSSKTNFSDSIQLTLKSYPKLLGYSLLLTGVYAALTLTYHMIDFSGKTQLLTLLMAGWLLWIPTIAGYLHFHAKILNHETPSFKESFINGFSKILGILSTLFGVLLLPSFVLGIGAIASFVCIQRGYEQALWGIGGIAAVLTLLLLNSNLLSLIIVSTETQESGAALDKSKRLINGNYFKTFFSSTLIFLLLIALFTSPIWIKFLFSVSPTMELVLIICACLDILLIGPILWGMMISDLQRKEHQLSKLEPVSVERKKIDLNIKETPKGKIKDQDWF